MTALIVLVLLAAAAWFVMNAAGGTSPMGRVPGDSVSDFSRAMHALDPAARPALPPVDQPPVQPAAR